MQWKPPKNTEKYYWTAHVANKMRYYGLSSQKILGVINRPKRIETGIAQDTVAVMIPAGTIKKEGKEESWKQEIWVMYQLKNLKFKISNLKLDAEKKNQKLKELQEKVNTKKQITIISAWRFPGMSPKNNPIPDEIIRELEELQL